MYSPNVGSILYAIRLRRWSFFQAMRWRCFFFLLRCDIDYFWRYPTITIGAIIFPNNRDRLFYDVFSNFQDRWFAMVGKQKNTYFRRKSNSRQIMRKDHCIIQGVFFLTGTPLKVLCVRLLSKSHQKNSKCQKFLRVCVWVIFRMDQ